MNGGNNHNDNSLNNEHSHKQNGNNNNSNINNTVEDIAKATTTSTTYVSQFINPEFLLLFNDNRLVGYVEICVSAVGICIYCYLLKSKGSAIVMVKSIFSLPVVVICAFAAISAAQSLPRVISLINNLSLKQHILLCAIAAISALFVLLCSLFTYTTILSFIGCVTLTCTGVCLAINDIRRYGLASYLPDWILETEYPQTIDEYLRDSTFFMENRYLLLYFIPGIDLENSIRLLPERRRETLFRKWTVADIFGLNNNSTTTIVEEEEMLLLLHDESPNEDALVVPALRGVPSDLEWDVSPQEQGSNDDATPVQENQIVQYERNNVVETVVPIEVLAYNNTTATETIVENADDLVVDPRQEEWNYEEDILNNAISSLYQNTSNSIVVSATNILQSYGSFYSTQVLVGNLFVMSMFGSLALFLPSERYRRCTSLSYAGVVLSGSSLMVRLGLRGLVSWMENQGGAGSSSVEDGFSNDKVKKD